MTVPDGDEWGTTLPDTPGPSRVRLAPGSWRSRLRHVPEGHGPSQELWTSGRSGTRDTDGGEAGHDSKRSTPHPDPPVWVQRESQAQVETQVPGRESLSRSFLVVPQEQQDVDADPQRKVSGHDVEGAVAVDVKKGF